jgi:hypothetical protein
MCQRSNVSVWILSTFLAATACGGGQAPAESPEQAPGTSETTPAEPTDAAPAEGEHTMPDGTTMPGHHHEEGTAAPAPEEKSE